MDRYARTPRTVAVLVAVLVIVASGACEPDGGSIDVGRATGAGTSPERCQGQTATIVGDEGDDTLRGTDGDDVIVGLAGDDAIFADSGEDIVCAGAGDDRVDASGGYDSVEGGSGKDMCSLGNGGGLRDGCEDPTILAAGDIACPGTEPHLDGGAPKECGQRQTGDIVTSPWPNLVAVLMLGDAQYGMNEGGSFSQGYGPTWGPVLDVTYPVPGSEEYEVPGAAVYYRYFRRSAAASASQGGPGYYSFDLNGWHVVGLNSSCWTVGGCGPSDPEATWLRSDLAQSDARCTLAMMHHPRFSSSADEPNGSVLAMWDALYDAHADVVLSGNNHNYERFEPQDPQGHRDRDGIQEFVVGTGGVNLHPFKDPLPTSVVRYNDGFGVLELTLRPAAFEWRFLAVDGAFEDGGMGECV